MHPYHLIDTHCHLSDLSESALASVLTNADENHVTTLIAIGAGYGVDENKKTLELTQKYPQIFCALGMHPHDAKLVTDDVLLAIKNMAVNNSKVVAIGEIGLDYHYMHSEKDVQHKVLADFTEMAKAVKKPVSIHDRDCDFDCVNILESHGAKDCGGLVHCFTGSWDLAKRYLDLGFYVSFSGVVTFKKSDDLRETAKKVPLDRMLIETDSPFLAPMPFRGKTNDPAYVKFVAQTLADLRGLSLEDLANTTTQNAKNIFGL